MNHTLHKNIWIDAPLESVYNCFTKSEAMLAWHGKEVELNPVPGGVYKVVFEDGTVILGQYLSVDPLKKVVYTASYGNVSSVITVEFFEEDGGTRLKLEQVFDPGQDISSFDAGWDYFLGLLQKLLQE